MHPEKHSAEAATRISPYLPDLSLGDLLEGIAPHALENKPPFSTATLKKIADLKRVYGLDLAAGEATGCASGRENPGCWSGDEAAHPCALCARINGA